MGRKVNFLMLSLLVLLCLLLGTEYQFIENTGNIDTGDTAWMLVASAFVLLMTPGLAFFYFIRCRLARDWPFLILSGVDWPETGLFSFY